MTRLSTLAVAEPLASEAAGDWVLPLSLDQPARELPSSVQWAKRGHVCGFFHGLLFDRQALCKSLDCSEDCSDADLVARAYERGGEGALSGLRGSFVVAIVDGRRGIAIVARDPLGSHPLFYVQTPSQVLFASSPKPLLQQAGVSRALNRAALADHLCHRWPDPQETFFAAVRRVLPGWRAIVSGGRLGLERYWHPTPEGQPIQWLQPEEIAQFDTVLNRAVDRCLGHGPTGIFLSGGLDSISVAAIATDRARTNGQSLPLALSLAFPDPECDERLLQAAVARDLGLGQHLLNLHEAVGPGPLLEQSLALNAETSAPILNPWQSAYLGLAQRASRQGVRTIMTGQGGDEWLTVTPYLAADLIRRGALVELAQFFATLRRSYSWHSLALARHALWRCGLRPLGALALHRLMPRAHNASRLQRQLAGDPSWVAPDGKLREQQRQRAELALPPCDPPQGFYAREMSAGTDHILTSWEMEEQYQLGKQIGIRFLHPFMDPDVVAMLSRTPPRALNEGGRSKGLVRQTLARRFPKLQFERQRKVLATTFYQRLLRQEVPALAGAVGNFPALSALGIIDGRATQAAIREGLKHPGPQIQRLWAPLNLEKWVQAHGGH